MKYLQYASHLKNEPTSHPWWDDVPAEVVLEFVKTAYLEIYLGCDADNCAELWLNRISDALHNEVKQGWYLCSFRHEDGVDLSNRLNPSNRYSYFIHVQADLPEVEGETPDKAIYKMLMLIHYMKTEFPEQWELALNPPRPNNSDDIF